jgi:hypothetical protein
MNLDQLYDWKPETWKCQTEGAQRYVEVMEWLQNLLILLLQLMSNADATLCCSQLTARAPCLFCTQEKESSPRKIECVQIKLAFQISWEMCFTLHQHVDYHNYEKIRTYKK